jgi:hypothetical protein
LIYLIFIAKDAKGATEVDASNAVAQVETVEINDNFELLPAKLKVRDNLRLMDGGEQAHGFDLNNDEVFYGKSSLYPASSLTSLYTNGKGTWVRP